MSEQGTEQGSPQRKQKARERGDIVRSRELLSAMAMLGGLTMLGTTAQHSVRIWGQVYSQNIRSITKGSLDELAWDGAIRRMLAPALMPIALVMLASFSAAFLSGVLQGGGVSLHMDAIGIKFSRINPLTNLGNLFSLRSAARLLKSLVPAVFMAALGWWSLKDLMLAFPTMGFLRLSSTFSTAYRLALDAAWITLVWSALDYALEWRSWNDRMKMTKQEIREEIRDAMGNPQIKMRVRQIQMAMRKRKVKADLSRASVVITNPTHYAVALEFSFDTMAAPTVLAKGRDLFAAEIREEARWLGIPLIENPPLARSLYRMAQPGDSIPFELYSAVAGILAYLHRQKVEERRNREREAEARRRQQKSQADWNRPIQNFGGGI